jgi:nucleoside-diphosphate-sugar epimerase
MNVLVIGGTSFFGKGIVSHLLGAGHDVTVFSRGNQRPAWWDDVHHVLGDRGETVDLATLHGTSFDAVIDNIAFTADEVAAVLDVLGPGTGRYIFTSTGAMYFTTASYPPYEEDDADFDFTPPPAEEDSPAWVYTMGKLEAERTIMQRADLTWTIIRPPIVVGPDDGTRRAWFYFQRLLDGKPVLLPDGGHQTFTHVYSEDLARGYLVALESDHADQRIYNMAQAEIVTLRDFITSAAAGLGIDPDLVPVPASNLAGDDWIYPDPYSRMHRFVLSNRRAEDDLGYTTTPFDEWMGVTARWYRDEYDGPDSAGYEQRDREIEIAGRFRSA